MAIVSEVFLPAIDGVVTRLMRTLEELSDAGDEVLMLAPAGGPDRYAGVKVVGMPARRMPLYPDGRAYPPKRVSPPTRQLAQVLGWFDPDVIHAVNPVLLGLSAVRPAHRQQIPLVASYHTHLPTYAHLYRLGWMEPLGWRYLRAVHNRAQVNLCTSRAAGLELVRRGFDRVALWPYGVDTRRFAADRASVDWRARLSGDRPDRTVLLYVGRLAKEKTIERLLEAARLEGVALAIVGDGPLRPRLEQLFAGTPTQFLGFLEGEGLARAYASADVFLMPSDTETLGLVTLEAQASGLPVIAAESPASRDLICDGRTGLRFDAATPGALAGLVGQLIDDPGRRAAMSHEAARAVRGHTWRTATSVLRRHYQHARRQGPRPRAPAASAVRQRRSLEPPAGAATG